MRAIIDPSDSESISIGTPLNRGLMKNQERL